MEPIEIMNNFPMSDGLEIIRNLTENGNKNLHYFDKEPLKTEEKPAKQGFDFECMWRWISFITIAVFIVCAGFNIVNDFTNILVLVMIVSLAGWFIWAVVEGKRQGFRLQVPATKTSTGELDQGYEFSQSELNKIGLTHELLDAIEENDNYPVEIGIAFFNPNKANSPLDKQIKDIINLLVFAKLTDLDSQADQLIGNYTVMQAIATGLMQTAKIGEDGADDYHDLSKQFY